MKKIVFDEPLNNDEMGAVISALIMRRNQLKEFISGLKNKDCLCLCKIELDTINDVLDKIHIEG